MKTSLEDYMEILVARVCDRNACILIELNMLGSLIELTNDVGML